jgi:hypothetical protein
MGRLLFIFSALFMLWSPRLNAQLVKGVDESKIIYRNVVQGGVSLNSRGLGLHFRKGKKLHYTKTFLYDCSLQNLKHPKEVKSVNAFSKNSNGFLYGKLISLNAIQLGAGIQKTIYPKNDTKSIAIGYSWFGGFSLAMAKPVYLYIFHQSDMEGIQEKLERYNPEKHFPDNISSRAPFFKGFQQSRFYPGLYGTWQINCSFGSQEEKIKMLETGISLNAYPAKISIMADDQPGQYLFFNFFIRFIFGKQWNHP